MQSENRLFDDVARMAGGALSMLTGLKSEIEALVRAQVEGWMGSLHLVTREEFDLVRDMAAKARDEQESLLARIQLLESERTAAPSGKPAARRAGRAKSTRQTNQTSL
jgi:BMFP domain-containing protein YqiC